MPGRFGGEVSHQPSLEDEQIQGTQEKESKFLGKYYGDGSDTIDKADLEKYLDRFIRPGYVEMGLQDLNNHIGYDIAVFVLDSEDEPLLLQQNTEAPLPTEDQLFVEWRGKLISIGQRIKLIQIIGGTVTEAEITPDTIKRLFVKIKKVGKRTKSGRKLLSP